MSSPKAMIIHLKNGLIKLGSTKKAFLYKTSFFPEPCTRFRNKIKIKLDFFNYGAMYRVSTICRTKLNLCFFFL